MNKKRSMDELHRLSVIEFQKEKKVPIIIILDNIRSMNNIGSAFRTADAFKVEKIFLVGISATPPNREITKTALGADESVNWEYNQDILTIIEKLKADNYIICAIEQVEKSIMLQDFKPLKQSKYAFIFGNEVFGVNDIAIQNCDYSIEIPQFGTKHSLNISVTIGIICWDFLSKTIL